MTEPGLLQDTSEVLFAIGDSVFAVTAERVIKVVPTPPIIPLPFSPVGLDGVAAVGGKVVPLLTLPAKTDDGQVLILVRHNGDDYGLRADRVLRMTGRNAAPAHIIDIAALVAAIGLVEARGLGLSGVEIGCDPVSPTERADAAPDVRVPRSAALAVETARTTYLLALECVIELHDSMPIVALPDPRPFLAGAAFYGDELLPVVSLGALENGLNADGEPSNAFVVAAAAGRRGVLAVKSVIGLTRDASPDRIFDLDALFNEILPDAAAGIAQRPLVEAEPQSPATRYLLVEYAGQLCAFAMAAVAHIHPRQPLLGVPHLSASASVAGVTAISGRILPVLELGKLFGFAAAPREDHCLLELKLRQAETFAVAVDKILGIVSLAQDMLLRPPEDTCISALAALDSKIAWVLEPQLITEAAGWRLHAA